MRLSFYCAFLFFVNLQPGFAQWDDAAVQPVLLQNLDIFQPASKNWKIEGKANTLREIHQHMATEPGTGVLVNRPDATAKDNLITKQEYGDLDLEVEFLMPNGSNSGIYLMGRYEIQLTDSWKKDYPCFGDCGGIYERWDPSRGKGREGFEGIAPMSNECRAPGLWQKLRLSFDAPRFDALGKKLSHARLHAVWLNGIKIHNQVELTGPTRGAISPEEKPAGPLMLQGDHGPVAFRNLRIGAFNGEPLSFAPWHYHVVKGSFATLALPVDTVPLADGNVPQISPGILATDDDFYITYQGRFEVRTTGMYTFTALIAGIGALVVDNDTLIRSYTPGNYWDRPKGAKNLGPGMHTIRYVNAKSDPKKKFALGLTYHGPGIREIRLHAEGAIPTGTGTPTLALEREARPYVQRAFYMHQGVKKAYGIHVSDPTGINFTLNANTGRLNRVWRSPVLGDVTGMWVDRGATQLLAPRSGTIELTDKALLGATPEGYADTLTQANEFRYLGYNEKPGSQPVFRYRTLWGELRLQCHTAGHTLLLEGNLTLKDPRAPRPCHLMAEGRRIELLKDGSYRVDDQYYLVPDPDLEGLIKLTTSGGVQRLYVPFTGPTDEVKFRYQVVW